MNILALTLVSHLTVGVYKPLNLWKVSTRTQTIEEVIKPLPKVIAESFGRSA